MIRFILVAAALAGGCKKKAAVNECPASVAIEVAYPGASPAEVEQRIVLQVEAAIATIESVSAIHSMAAEGRAVFEVEVSGRPEVVERQLYAAIEALDGLPAEAEMPRMRRPPRFEKLVLAVAGLDAAERVEQELASIHGVRAVVAIGAPNREIRVTYDPSRMIALGLSSDVLARAIRSGTGEVGARVISERPDGSVVRLADVARIAEARAEGPEAFVGGRPVVVFAIASGDEPPSPGALRAAGVERLGAPIDAAICPRAFGLGLGAVTAIAPGNDATALAARLADLPVAVIRGADLLDRGASDDIEIIALDDLAPEALRQQPGLDVYAPGAATALVELTGDDTAALERVAGEIARAAAAIEGVTGIRALPGRAAPEMRVKLDRERLAALGLSAIDVAMAVRRATTGEVAAIVRNSGSPTPVRVMAGGAGERLEGVVLATRRGQLVPLSAVAAIELGSNRSIYRRDRRRRSHVRIAVGDLAAIARVESAVSEISGASGVAASIAIDSR